MRLPAEPFDLARDQPVDFVVVAQVPADESDADNAAVWLRETPAGSGSTNDHQIDVAGRC
jgi:hypothetical protein